MTSLEKTQTNALLLKYIKELSQALIDKDTCIEKLRTESEKQRKKHLKKINKLEGAKRHRYFLMSLDPENDYRVDNTLAFGSQSQVIDYIFKEMRILADPNEIACALFDGSHTFSSPGRRYFLVKDTFSVSSTSREKKDDSRLTDARKKLLAVAQAKEKNPPSDGRSVNRSTKSKSEEESDSEEAKPKKKKPMMPKKGMKIPSSSEDSSSDSEKSYKHFSSVPKGPGYQHSPGKNLSQYDVIFNGSVLRTCYAKNDEIVAKTACISIIQDEYTEPEALKFTVVNVKSDHHTFWKAWGSRRNYYLKKEDELSSLSSEPKPKAKKAAVKKGKAKSKGAPLISFHVSCGDSQWVVSAHNEKAAAKKAAAKMMKTKLDYSNALEIKVENNDYCGSVWKAFGFPDVPKFELLEEFCDDGSETVPDAEYEVRLGSDKFTCFANSVREAAEQGCRKFLPNEMDSDAVEIRVTDVNSGNWWTWQIWGTSHEYDMELVEEE